MGPFSFGPVMSRNASADNPKVVRQMQLLSYTFGQGKQLIMISLGIAAFVAVGYTLKPENMSMVDYEQIVTPTYLGNLCPPVLKGVLFTGFLFAFISTNDTYILSWSSIWINDVICVIRKKPFSTVRHLWALRIAIVLISIFLYFWGVYVMRDTNTTVLNYIMLTGTMFSGGAIALVMGLYWSRANTVGAYAATLVGMIFPLVDLTMRRFYNDSYSLTPQQAGIITMATALVLLVVFGLISKKPTKWVDYGEIVRESEQKDKALSLKLSGDKE
jgi:SSS family solute:Na+ symporter